MSESELQKGDIIEKRQPLVFTKEWPSTLGAVDGAEEQFVGFLRENGWEEEDLVKLALGFREAFVNAVRHGNKFDQGRKVRVGCTVSPLEVVVTIQDEGAGFKQEDVADPLSAEGLIKQSGRGVLLMKSSYDSVVNHNLPEGGHETVLTKKRG